jgi:hypothetical protein
MFQVDGIPDNACGLHALRRLLIIFGSTRVAGADGPIWENPHVKINSYFNKLAFHAASVNGFCLHAVSVYLCVGK